MQRHADGKVNRLSTHLLVVTCIGLASGAGATNCAFGFTATPLAILLPVTSATPQRVQVGSISQNCNGNGSYTLVIASGNCLLLATGAKLMDWPSTDFADYSVEFDNPTTGSSQPVVTGLLANSCYNAVGRNVDRAKISNESSGVFVNFTGSTVLAAGTYSDTLSVTLNVN